MGSYSHTKIGLGVCEGWVHLQLRFDEGSADSEMETWLTRLRWSKCQQARLRSDAMRSCAGWYPVGAEKQRDVKIWARIAPSVLRV
eukprot:3072342-Amphidinium_carterae.1